MNRLTSARVTNKAKLATSYTHRWSTEKGVDHTFLVRVLDALDVTTELRLLNAARDAFRRSGYEATVVSLGGGRKKVTYRLMVTDTEARQESIDRQADARAAALDAAREEVAAAEVTETVEQWGPDAVVVTREYDELLASAPVLAARAASEAAWEEEAHAAGFATGDDYASFLTEDLPEPAEEKAPSSGTEYVVFCPNHQHYLRHASAGGTTWIDSQEEARRYYTKTQARRQVESATWLDHNPTSWALPSAGPALLDRDTRPTFPEDAPDLTVQAQGTIAAMQQAREAGLTPAVVTLTNPELWG